MTRRANRKKRLTVHYIVEHPNQEGDTCIDWTSQYCWANGWNCLWQGHSVYRNRPLIPQHGAEVQSSKVLEGQPRYIQTSGRLRNASKGGIVGFEWKTGGGAGGVGCWCEGCQFSGGGGGGGRLELWVFGGGWCLTFFDGGRGAAPLCQWAPCQKEE